jgi:hypothetical protein
MRTEDNIWKIQPSIKAIPSHIAPFAFVRNHIPEMKIRRLIALQLVAKPFKLRIEVEEINEMRKKECFPLGLFGISPFVRFIMTIYEGFKDTISGSSCKEVLFRSRISANLFPDTAGNLTICKQN